MNIEKISIIMTLCILFTFSINTVIVEGSPPIVDDIPNQTINKDETFALINLDDYVYDPENSDDEINWTYNGNVNLIVSINASRIATVSFPIEWAGSETITFTATDPNNESGSDDVIFTVNDPPIADFSWIVNTLEVEFTDLSTDSDGNIVTWNWDFGDNASSVEKNPMHSYNSAGTYLVNLTVTDNNGANDSKIKSVKINQSSITISSPDGGEIWYTGGDYSITWNSLSAGDYVTIELYENGYYSYLIDSSEFNDGSYSWAIPSTISTSSNYQIKITSISNSSLYDYSDEFFSISQPFITITSPNGEETWYKGETYTIRWSSGNVGNNVEIELYQSGYYSSSIGSSEQNDGSYSWAIPSSISTSSNYQIKITSTDDNSIYDYSDSYFTISGLPFINVTSPIGGETWYVEKTYEIKWDTENAGSYVKIELYKLNTFLYLIESNTNNNGWHYWTIPSTLESSTNYKIKITSTSDATIFDYSDEYFTLSDKEPIITIPSPDYGEKWYKGETYIIQWNSQYVGDFVEIGLYRNGYLSSLISSNTSNDGSLSWLIPLDLYSDSRYTIRITSLLYPDISFESGYFSVEDIPSITIPSDFIEEEIWHKGETYTITWNSINAGDYVKIELYKNDLPWYTITSQARNNINGGSYEWMVPDTIEYGTDYRIKISSTSDSTVYGYCQGFFTIEETWLQKWQGAIIVSIFILIIAAITGDKFHKKRKEKKQVLDQEKKDIINLISKTTQSKTSGHRQQNKKERKQKSKKKSRHLTWEEWFKNR